MTIVAVTNGAALELPRTALASLLAQDKMLSLALERSVRRGLALLDRDGAARKCQPLDQGGSILQRIRILLGSHSRAV